MAGPNPNPLPLPPVALGFGKSSYSSKQRKALETRHKGLTAFQALTLQWLQLGGRHLDTALKYGNTVDVGAGLRLAIERGIVTRQDVFITSKFMLRDLKKPGDITKMLKPLQTTYIDLLLLHTPGESRAERLHAWEAAVVLWRKGTVRMIGVSNYRIEHYHEISNTTRARGNDSMPLPYINQVEWHVGSHDEDLLSASHSLGIRMQGFSVLGFRSLQAKAKRPATSASAKKSPPVLQGPYAPQPIPKYSVPWDHHGLVWIARAYGLTPQQVIFDWALSRLGAIVVATASEEHMLEALNTSAVHERALHKPSIRYLNALGSASQPISLPRPPVPPLDDHQRHTEVGRTSRQLFTKVHADSLSQAPSAAPVVRVNGIIGSNELYAQLNADYPLPGGLRFQDDFPWKREAGGETILQPSGRVSSLAIWYDSAEMATILENSAAWRLFDDYVNSAEFVDYVVRAFHSKLATSQELLLDWRILSRRAARRHVWHSQVESKEDAWYRRSPARPFNQTHVDPQELFTIWSFQAQRLPPGAVFRPMKGPHRDQENRIFSLVIYFSDGDPSVSGWGGGEFRMHDGNNAKAFGETILSELPQQNLGLIFLCNRNSIHSISNIWKANTSATSRGFKAKAFGRIHRSRRERQSDEAASANKPGTWRKTVYVSVASRSSAWRHVSMGSGKKDWVLPISARTKAQGKKKLLSKKRREPRDN